MFVKIIKTNVQIKYGVPLALKVYALTLQGLEKQLFA